MLKIRLFFAFEIRVNEIITMRTTVGANYSVRYGDQAEV
jgi:hypothetical protein